MSVPFCANPIGLRWAVSPPAGRITAVFPLYYGEQYMQKLQKMMSSLGHRLGVAVLAAMMVALCAFAMPNEAEARGGLELDGGFGYVGRIAKNNDEFHGFAFSIGIRYRLIDWLALGVEQDLGGMFQDDDSKYHNGFYGATIFGGKFIYAVNKLELFGNLGIGAVYMDMEHDGHSHHVDPWHHAHHEWDDARFGLRLGIGGTYMMMQNVGVGLNFDYTPSFKDDFVMHFLRLQLHVVFIL